MTVEDDRSCFDRGCGHNRDDCGGGGDCRGGDLSGSFSDDDRGGIVADDSPRCDGGTFVSTLFVVGRVRVSHPLSRSSIAAVRRSSRRRWDYEKEGREGQGQDRDCPCRDCCRGINRELHNRNRRRIADCEYSGCHRGSESSSSAAASSARTADLLPGPNALAIGGHHSLPWSSSGKGTKESYSSYSLVSPGHSRRQERRGRRRVRSWWRNDTSSKSVVAIGTIVAAIFAVTTTATLATTGHLPRIATAAMRSAAVLGGNGGCTGRGSLRASWSASMSTSGCLCFAPPATLMTPPLRRSKGSREISRTPRRLPSRCAQVMRGGNWSYGTQHPSSHPMRHCFPSSPRSHRLSSASTDAMNGEGGGGRSSGATSLDGAAASTTILAEKREQLRSSTRLSLAPMMDYTDRHFRYLMRLITSRTLLYSEMVAANALAHERRASLDFEEEGRENQEGCYDDFYLRRFLAQSPLPPGEGPSVLQLGGSDPRQMYESARAVLEASSLSLSSGSGDPYPAEYTALNLNCGCPSPKVANKGCFGAALMHDPHLVRQLCSSMSEGADGTHPVTVKCRIGTDSTPDDDDLLYSGLCRFVDTVASGGVVTDFQVHARIAILKKKISPAKNRSVPPLKYHLVRRLAAEFPELTFTLNGGVDNLIMAGEELKGCGGPGKLAGVMVGRGMAAAPWNWATADEYLFGGGAPNVLDDHLPRDRWELLRAYGAHADSEEATYGTKVRRFILRALQGVFAGEPNAKRFRVALDEIGGLPKREEEARRRRRRQLGEDCCDDDDSSAEPTGTPLSELILRAARDCFSDEVLHRTREESFEIMRLGVEKEESRRRTSSAAASVSVGGRGGDECVVDGGEGSRSAVVREWQTRRKEEEGILTDAKRGNREDAGEGWGLVDGTNRWVQSS